MASNYKQALTTVFWVGEEAAPDNAFIPNAESAWDTNWQEHFGGADAADDRCGYKPCGFTPKENPFYFALPYSDLDAEGKRKKSAAQIPWFAKTQNKQSVVKNIWIEVRYNGKSCYAQWEDVGPFETDNFTYVFGADHKSSGTNGIARLDISPAIRDCLNFPGRALAEWKFLSESEIPPGPWKETVTTSDVRW